jgi:NO-binding membrane sensor protein with MHYT domain
MVVNYQLDLVLLSIGVAILGSLTALALTSFSAAHDASGGQRSVALISGGMIMGATIWSMHFVAMMAVDLPVMSAIRGCGLDYDYVLVGISVGLAIGASMAALWFAFYKRNVLMTVAGGIVQGLAIASMHYTAMAATYFVPLGTGVQISTPLFSQSRMAYMIAAGIVLISAVNLTMVALMSGEDA